MIFFWLGIFFLAALGIFLFPLYGTDTLEAWPVILGAGILSNVIGCYKTRVDSLNNPRRRTVLFLIPLAAGIYAFRFPYSLPLYVLAAGILAGLLFHSKPLRPLCSGLLFSGLVMSLQTACVPPYFKLAARYHDVNMLTPFFYWLLKLLGVLCAYSQDAIFVQTSRSILTLVTTWEKLGLYFFITVFAGALVLLCLLRIGKTGFLGLQKIGILLLTLIGYGLVRYIFVTLFYVDLGKVEIFWEPFIVTASFLPLPFILWRLITPEKAVITPLPDLNFSIQGLYVAAAMLLAAFCLTGFCCFQDPGILKKGRILVDEFHSNWEWTDKKFDTKWFGIQSVYNYYCFADYLNHFYVVKRLKEEVSSERLSKADVLIIKTPTSPFTLQEIRAIVEFVRQGGGLFLIGDHTNVFGTTININPLAERFGIRFNYDATYDLRTSDLHLHEHNSLFRHPVVREMPYFLFATSCSLSAPFFAEDVMTASNLKTMYLDYSRGGYFPDKTKEQNYTFGLFLQSVGRKYGRGRVLAFSDSTCFSNFYMPIPGKPEFAAGAINWLNRMNRYDRPVKALSLAVMVMALGFLAYFFISQARMSAAATDEDPAGNIGLKIRKFMPLLVSGGLLGVSFGTILFGALADSQYALPKEHTAMIKIGFEETHCNFNIPAKRLLHNPAIDFQTFYVWPLRLGYFPTLFSLAKSLDDFEIVVFINPKGNFSAEEKRKIDHYITKGGKLLLIDDPQGKQSSAYQLIQAFGMNIRYDQYQQKAVIYDGATSIGTIESFAPVTGGEPRLLAQKGKPLIATVKKGNGMVAVMACSPSFTNEQMGATESTPDEHQQFLYKLEFWLLSSLINNRFESFADFR